MKLFRRFSSAEFDKPAFPPETYDAVIRSSICTGEKVAGFRNKKDGNFTEVMLIRSDKDLEDFKTRYHVTTIKTIY